MKGEKKKEGFQRKARLQLSFQAGALVIIICAVFSIYGSFIFISSLVRLSNKSEEKVLNSVGSMISSSQQYNAILMGKIQSSRGAPPITSREFINQVKSAAPGGTITETQNIGNQMLESSVEEGILGITLSYYALPPGEGAPGKPIIVITSDDDCIYAEVPDEIAALMDNGGSAYKLFEKGIPGMGYKEPCMVTAYEVTGETPGDALWYFNFKPMDELMAALDGYFARETRTTYLLMFLVLGVSTIGMLILAIMIMGQILRRRIARPIEELSADAERVMDGDLDVQATIKPHEDFADLKMVFNQLVSNLNRILSRAAGQEPDGALPDAEKARGGGKRARGKYLEQKSTTRIIIVALFSLVFLLSGLLSIVVVSWSLNRMVTKTEEKLVATEAALMSGTHEFGFDLIMKVSELTPDNPDSYQQAITDFGRAVTSKTVSRFQELTGGFLKDMVEYNLYGVKLIYNVTPPTPPLIEDYLVLLSSDARYLYTTPPKGVINMLQKEMDSWRFFKNGFPQLGMAGECLVSTYRFAADLPAGFSQREIYLWSVMYKPMGEELHAINAFYDEEIRKLERQNAVSAALSVLTAAIVMWFGLGRLIRRKITQPIDELVLAAREVVEGNFDVTIEIRPGEELKSLKRAFNAMIKSMHELIERSMQG